MSGVLTALEELPRQNWYRGQVVRIEPLESRAPEYAVPDPALPEPLARYLESEGISSLYSHQVDLLAAVRRGGNAVITTGTASGKTLGFNLPVVEKLLQERSATALYLYPMKAVTQDQLKVLRRMEEATGIRLRPDIYDGDTPQDRRAQIRRSARIVLSNPYELHQILPWHYQWQKFLAGLRFVVIDEAHRYRGVFGSNVAQLLRRFRRLCHLYGSSPQFILASASIANPEELARNLVGLDFTHIGRDGSPRGRSWLMLFNPLCDPETSAHTQVSRLVAHLCRFDLQTLCFVISRRTAELISRRIREAHPELPVAAYRAGYLPEDRRAIEADFAQGRLRGVVSTEALELGINVGSLDAIVTFGWPHTLASFWQQAGRAGRRLQDSLVGFVAFADALDQFLLRHPERILDRHFESAVIDLTNPYILKGHLACAASETPLRDKELDAVTAPLARELEQAVILRRTPAGLVYSGTDRPHEHVQLEAIEAHSIEVVCAGRIIETIDRSRAFREAYPGAIMLHMGETYAVKSLDLKAGRAEVEPTSVDWFTQVVQHEELKVLKKQAGRTVADGVELALGRVQVTERFPGYHVRRGTALVSTHPLDLPVIEFPTVGLWLHFHDPELPTGTLHAAEHALIGLAPLVAMCDPMDIGGTSYPAFPETGLPAIFIYDGFEHGIGICEKLYAEFDRLAQVTAELLRDCPCDSGCPACIISPRCGDSNQPLDKRGAARLLRRLADSARPL